MRARCVAGDKDLCAAFEHVRNQTLSRARSADTLRSEVSVMRQKMRAELDRSEPARFDLKQGEGGLVDLEFLLQFVVLRDAALHAELIAPRETAGLLEAAHAAGSIGSGAAATLRAAHAALLAEGLACTLDRRPRLVPPSDAMTEARNAIRHVATQQGLAFS